MVRRGLKQILEDQVDIKVVEEAKTAQEALDQVRNRGCDVLLLDIDMPGRSGLDVLKVLREERPRLPVLVLSVHPEEQFAVRVIKSGAAGYLTKETAPEELVKAIRTAFGSGKYITPYVAVRLASEVVSHRSEEAPHLALSNREFEVLRMIASGKTVSEIAQKISLSVKTISTYRARILEKMGMKTNAELTHYAIKNNLV